MTKRPSDWQDRETGIIAPGVEPPVAVAGYPQTLSSRPALGVNPRCNRPEDIPAQVRRSHSANHKPPSALNLQTRIPKSFSRHAFRNSPRSASNECSRRMSLRACSAGGHIACSVPWLSIGSPSSSSHTPNVHRNVSRLDAALSPPRRSLQGSDERRSHGWHQ